MARSIEYFVGPGAINLISGCDGSCKSLSQGNLQSITISNNVFSQPNGSLGSLGMLDMHIERSIISNNRFLGGYVGSSGNKFTITGNNNIIQGNFWHGFSGDSVVNSDNNVITGNASFSTGTIIDNGSRNVIENNRL